MPVNRRNLTNLMSLTPGVSTSGAGDVQMNGVAAGGTGVTVDGTEANSNPEARSLAQYGGQNQISVMSLDSISEVQIVKGVLPAEYRRRRRRADQRDHPIGHEHFPRFGVLQRPEREIQRPPFSRPRRSRLARSIRYGGTLGGPVLRNKAFFFGTYEGYRENVQVNLDMVVPYQAVRGRDSAGVALP